MDASFDIVFSSNVLEHVTDMDGLNTEIVRVLKPTGTAIHFVPTSIWRTLSLLAHYPALARDTAGRAFGRTQVNPPRAGVEESSSPVVAVSSRETTLQKIVRRSVPRLHGSEGTPLGELRRFSKPQWDRFFARHGWHTIGYERSAMILSGETLLGDRLPLGSRRSIAAQIGGSAHLYILKRDPTQAQAQAQRFAYYERHYRDLLPSDRDAAILDIGCGQGDLLRFLHAEGYRAVAGIDADAKLVDAIEPMEGVMISQATASADFLRERPQAYDTIIMKQMIYYLSRSDASDFVRAAAGALKPGGQLIVEVFNGALLSAPYTEAKDPGILTRYTEHSLRGLLEANGFAMTQLSGLPDAAPGLRAGVYYALRNVWIAIWRRILILERGMTTVCRPSSANTSSPARQSASSPA